MNDRVKIVIGLALFVILATFPIWHAFGVSTPAPPDLAKPRAGTTCVENAEWMTANHAQLLDQWRDAVVREGKMTYISTDGSRHEMSLTENCLRCHGTREKFCDRCHTYADVQLTCWNCHLDTSPEVQKQ